MGECTLGDGLMGAGDSMKAPVNEPVDLGRVREASGGDLEFERDLFGIFLEDTEGHLEDLRGYLAGEDLHGARAAAHTIKGASGNVGAVGLHGVASRLERLAAEGDVGGVSRARVELEREFEAVRAYLRECVAGL